MKKIILSTFLALFMSGFAYADTVRMGTEGAYPPYNFINDNGEVDGFERDVGDLLCARANLDCVWVINEWDSIIPNLVSGNYDTIIAGMSITAERDEVIDFTQDYFPPSPSVFMALSGADVDLDGGVIAAQTSTIQAGYVAETGATLVEYATPEEADAVLADGDYLFPIIDESGGEFAAVGEVSLGGGIGMGIRESDGELKAKMNAAIDSMKADGSLNTLIKKWFGQDANTY
jgi:polar amino acid transport system substrate-binding protein